MLENIRENSQGAIAKVILGFIILTFAVAGIGGYTGAVDNSVAEVNGEKISQRSFDQAYQAQRSRLEQQFGEMFATLSADPTYMANLRKGVVDNLINEKLIDQNANELAIRVSDEQIKDSIRTMPEFQVNGVFDNNRYLAIINQAGFFQSSDFRDYLRIEMSRRQLSQALVGTEFSLPYQQAQLTALQTQKRDLNVAIIGSEQFKAGIELTEEEITAYYQTNQAMFQNQEKVKVDYVALDVNELAKGITVSDEELNTYYQENIASFRQEEQRRVSHILVELGDDEAASQSQAEEILAKVKQGEDFAELAKAHSADTFSGENGGDLEWLEAGVMEPAFDDAAFALVNVGDSTELVKSSFGYHIIKLTELKAEVTKAFDEVKTELHATVSNNKAQDKFFELQQELARVSFEFPDSLDDAANVVDATVMTSDWLARSGNLTPFDSVAVIDIAFSDLVLNENLNSDVIEVNDDLVMVVRLNDYQAADVKPLVEVKSQIETTLVNQKASDMAQALVTDLLAKFTANEDITAPLSEVSASLVEHKATARFGGSLDNAIVRQAFTLPHPVEGSVSAESVKLANGDLALVQVTAVVAGEETEIPNLAEQKTSQLAQAAYKNYVDSLKAVAKIKQNNTVEATTAY